ncbi:MAG TPA: type II toxin-antitoxin system HicA family toxin [Fimbriimonas sp.]|nr:type II toxin-antitoxin system HicA family toxin [Fimbriimonas sp.]
MNHLAAIRAFEKAGFQIERQGKHVTMSDGKRIITIPRHNPIQAFTMAGIVRDAGLTIEQFRELL